jgi:membrane-bound ClpP family serine protease
VDGRSLRPSHAMSIADDSPIGLAGRIVTPTRGEDGAGEVELRIRGGTEIFLARSAEPLQRGQAVIVLATLGPRTVVVSPWMDPVESLLTL